MLLMLLFVAGAAHAVPVPVNYDAGQDQRPLEVLAVGNYEAGSFFTESYRDVEKLQRNTEVVARSGTAQQTGDRGVLEASISSEVIGEAHIAWSSSDPTSGPKGRHAEIGRSVEDLAGVFSIEKFIQLWDNSSPGEVSIDWMPCL
jgi:hypothetical protein